VMEGRAATLQQTVYGHVADVGWVGGMGEVDEPVVSMSTPQLLNTNGQWLWRTSSQYGFGTSNPTLRFGETATTFNAETGDAVASTTTVTNAGAPSYIFGGDPSGQGGALALGNAAENIVSSSWFDAWGNSLGACAGANPGGTTVPTSPPAGCFRFGTVSYDTLYGQFPVSERAFTSATASLTTTVQANGWDRGLGAVRSVKDPNNEITTVTHDGLGRVTSMTPPPVAGCVPAPATVLRYELTSDGRTQPMSRVQTTTVNRTSGCEFATLGGTEGTTSTAYGYVDGLGRVRATVSQGVAEDNGDDVTVALSTWIRNGIAVLDPKGQAIRAFHPTYLSAGQENDYAAVVSLPTAAPSTRVELDAFGRTVVSFSELWDVSSMSYHAASTTACDPLDNGLGTIHTGTCTTSRSDGFGRVVDQILTEQIDNLLFYDRLWSYYRADGAVQTLVRTQTTDQNVRPATPPAMSDTSIRRDFYYDNVGRRLGSADPDSDNPSDTNPATNTWRYRFNRVGDLVGVRDPRGCGQNFFYDLGGRLLGEQYVACGETQTSATELPISDVPGGSIGESVLASAAMVDVRYEYDAAPTWLPVGTTPPSIGGYLGRATGVTDRGQRSAVAYDRRGLAIWTARQMALIPNRLALTTSAMGANYPTISEATPTSGSVAFDEAHTYVETSEMDHAGRPHRLILPLDPDFGGPAPSVVGEMAFNRMGAMHSSRVMLGGTVQPITTVLQYDEYGAVVGSEQGTALQQYIDYDDRRRPSASYASRTPTLGALPGTLNAIEHLTADAFTWDAASNLVGIDQNYGPSLPPPNMAPGHGFIQTRYISHDTLYRVSRVETYYSEDSTTDWRSDALSSNANDPMHPRPAGRVGTLPSTRVSQLDYAFDWLGNQTQWDDDAWSFFERSIGRITNGRETGNRPGALYLSTNITTGGIESTWGGAGWVEVNYGQGGNVSDYTVHGQCQDRVEPSSCSDVDDKLANRISNFQTNCTCATEQHFSLRWDELNRLVEGRRFDRVGGSVGSGTGAWTYAARMRYRYDGANQRTVKESFEATGINTASRVALFIYPGDFERRGLVRNTTTYDAVTTGVDATETQYMVAGARIVWDPATSATSPNFDRNRRITYALTDLLQTSSGVVDLASGELLELSTYYPNGARENLWASDSNAPLEPMGFTGKEADEEIGLTYFGERWLMPRLGRWASPDPLHVHASGGGEALNSYHYVSGNLLQVRDPLGLNGDGEGAADAMAAVGAGNEQERDESRRYQEGVDASAQLEELGNALNYLNSPIDASQGPGPAFSEVARRWFLGDVYYSQELGHSEDGAWDMDATLRAHESRMMSDMDYADGFEDAEHARDMERHALQMENDFNRLITFVGSHAVPLMLLEVTLGASGLVAPELGESIRLGSAVGNDFQPARLLRVVDRGESLLAIAEEAHLNQIDYGLETALITLRDRRRLLVEGGRDGIILDHLEADFGSPLRTLIAHTHPRHGTAGLSPDDAAALMGMASRDPENLDELGQRSTYVLHSLSRNAWRFYRGSL
jgi:RHS repeat-associated protein